MPEAEEGGGAEAKPVFAKNQRRGNFRKKTASKDDAEDEGGDVRKLIEETRRDQKYRERGVGVSADKLITSEQKEEDKPKQKLVDGVLPPGLSLLDSQFSGETEETQTMGNMEREMMNYIDAKLKKGKTEEKEEKPVTAVDELYSMPTELSVPKSQYAVEDNETNAAETWLTGIIEVALPEEEKLRNIAETERAKKRLLEETRTGVKASSYVVDTSTERGYARLDSKKSRTKPTTDDSRLKAMLPGVSGTIVNPANTGARPKTGTRTEDESGENFGSATDDQVAEKFSKKFRR
mmetsp:Transcript_25160/g.39507  ORF Transcript_25160/g.39507 Transcript_25160/m.39507 type:complete len:293 (+) Transcript_25160:507-1385(+)